MKRTEKNERKAWTREKKIKTLLIGISILLYVGSYFYYGIADSYFDKAYEFLNLGNSAEFKTANEKAFNMNEIASRLRIIAAFLVLADGFIFHIDRVDRGKWLYWLPNRYRIRKIEDEYIVLERVCGETAEQILPDCIAVFCRNERYVCVQTGIPGKKQRRKKDKDIPDTLDRTEYYILDTEAHQTYGPYYPWNFQIECHALGIGKIGKWIPTKPRPEFADPIFWEKPNEQ